MHCPCLNTIETSTIEIWQTAQIALKEVEPGKIHICFSKKSALCVTSILFCVCGSLLGCRLFTLESDGSDGVFHLWPRPPSNVVSDWISNISRVCSDLFTLVWTLWTAYEDVNNFEDKKNCVKLWSCLCKNYSLSRTLWAEQERKTHMHIQWAFTKPKE